MHFTLHYHESTVGNDKKSSGICVTPGVIGGTKPKLATPEIEKRVEGYKSENPGVFSWEVSKDFMPDQVNLRFIYY